LYEGFERDVRKGLADGQLCP